MRCVHEAQLHDHSWFLTLTYSDDRLPAGGSLHYRDFQLFMKRLRKRFRPAKLRFFMCGEYGEQLSRPHYHAAVFGLDLRDLEVWSVRQGNTLYRSPTLERLWPFGFVTVGAVTFESAAYIARYVVKKITGKRADEHYQGREPEFIRMSLRPGIGAEWLRRYQADVYTTDQVHCRGRSMKPPRYYDKKIRESDDDLAAQLEASRYSKSLASSEHNSPERLAVRETVARARLALKKRTLENPE